MNRILGVDGPVWEFLGKMTDVMILSLLFILTSLPVFTIGASLTALYIMMFRLSDDTEGSVIKGYFRAFKENIKRVTPVFLLMLFVLLFLMGDLYITAFTDMPGGRFFMPAAVIFLIIYLFFWHYFFPLFSKLKLPLKKILMLSFLMPVRELPRTVFMLFISFIMICVGVFVCAPFLLVVPGVVAFSHALLFRGVFLKLSKDEL